MKNCIISFFLIKKSSNYYEILMDNSYILLHPNAWFLNSGFISADIKVSFLNEDSSSD